MKNKQKQKKVKINKMITLYMETLLNNWMERHEAYSRANCVPLDEVEAYYVVKFAFEIATKHPKKTRKIMRAELEKIPDQVFDETWNWKKCKPYWGNAFIRATDAVWGPIAPKVREVF